MLRCSFGEDIDCEVDAVHFGIIVFFILLVDSLTLPLKNSVLVFQFSLLICKSSLDNLSSGEKSVFKILQGLVLDVNGSFFIKFTLVF
jgi:hypothetical protein